MSTPVPKVIYLQGVSGTGATANGNGKTVDTEGYDSVVQLEVIEAAGGTCTIAVQGSIDGTTWYAVGYQRVDNVAAPARAVANVSVTANLAAVYQLLDPYPKYRTVISSIAGGGSVTVRAYCVA